MRATLCGMILAGIGIGSIVADDSPAVELSRWIDDHLAETWKQKQIQPAQKASDAEWVRRVHLDLIGRIPSLLEVQEFVGSTDPDKDTKLVANLVERGAFADIWAGNILRGLLPETETSDEPNSYGLVEPIKGWLREMLVDHRPYDQIARELIACSFPLSPSERSISPASFYAIKKSKPEELASATSRYFLGVRIECAQCHDHPFAQWKRKEFWQFAAFYAGLVRSNQADGFQYPQRDEKSVREIKMEGTDELIPAAFLGEADRPIPSDEFARNALAEWIVDGTNPFFAKAAVNRVWYHLFGIGIVDPIDDMDSHNPPSHPEILDRLAEEFRVHGYDLRWLIRAIAGTRAYRLSSQAPEGIEIPPRSFARMIVRTMTFDQYSRSLAEVSGQQEESFAQRIEQVGNLKGAEPYRSDTSISQALLEMNGWPANFVLRQPNQLRLEKSLDGKAFSFNEAVTLLYQATLSRPPSEEELEVAKLLVKETSGIREHPFVELVRRLTNSRSMPMSPQVPMHSDKRDLLWVLINSSEFRMNH
ncbi:DUF1549 and DUF1553 domain-containing protein [bacterium]|nr:DUF1549 and DUF1553 domain-containing protein [bacterium]